MYFLLYHSLHVHCCFRHTMMLLFTFYHTSQAQVRVKETCERFEQVKSDMAEKIERSLSVSVTCSQNLCLAIKMAS